jgi:hypothetical protein
VKVTIDLRKVIVAAALLGMISLMTARIAECEHQIHLLQLQKDFHYASD